MQSLPPLAEAGGSDPSPSSPIPPKGLPWDVKGKRLDVQGLRALAVGIVVLEHANLGFPGGFVGVDISSSSPALSLATCCSAKLPSTDEYALAASTLAV